ncbi:hypothetical protein [Anaerovorax odorimutans]|uniref:hypothetical protein n=1 Tax=Anaerovorax odorimutans TaxID=109327 RepID=UPI0004235805|nr:hypothetical protein [Anaerovorax odorimutans]
MKIESSSITMNSTRNYDSVEFTRINSENTQWKAKPEDKKDKLESEEELSKFINGAKKLLEDDNQKTQIGSTITDSESAEESANGVTKPNYQLLANNANNNPFSITDLQDHKISLLRMMLEMLCKGPHDNNSFYSSISQKSQYSLQSMSINFGNAQSLPSSGTWVRNVNATRFFSETESTTFTSVGIAKTQDGRELNFGIDLEMTRSFMEYTNVKWSEQVIMTDPLVINLNSNPASLSDQKFCFDIDNDGNEDNISYLNKGSGYLALDKNNDGKINNGSELFGTKTGDGFSELSAYDSDKNGWIDENDEIYNKLKVWIKADDGTDKLINLKTADIGAIYLGSTKTDFTLKSQETRQTNGQIRQTGLYLKESTGAAETVQQIDVSV